MIWECQSSSWVSHSLTSFAYSSFVVFSAQLVECNLMHLWATSVFSLFRLLSVYDVWFSKARRAAEDFSSKWRRRMWFLRFFRFEKDDYKLRLPIAWEQNNKFLFRLCCWCISLSCTSQESRSMRSKRENITMSYQLLKTELRWYWMIAEDTSRSHTLDCMNFHHSSFSHSESESSRENNIMTSYLNALASIQKMRSFMHHKREEKLNLFSKQVTFWTSWIQNKNFLSDRFLNARDSDSRNFIQLLIDLHCDS